MIFKDPKITATEIKSAEIFFLFWEVDFDMADIEPSLERSSDISRLGSVLLECPENLLGLGDMWMAKKNYWLMCQRRFCKLVWIIEKTLVCLEGYLRLEMSLKTLLTIIGNGAKKATPIQNHMQNPQSVICQFANLRTCHPGISRSQQTLWTFRQCWTKSTDLCTPFWTWLYICHLKIDLPELKKYPSTLLISVAVILGSSKIIFGYSGKELYIALKNSF